MKTLAIALASVLVLCHAPEASAWSSPGHMVIAALAYQNLTPAQKQTVTDILTHHPDYQAWKKSYKPATSGLDLPTFIFMRASTWPDEIRRSGSPYDHPNWHFIDYPLKPAAFPQEPDMSPNDDVLYGIAQCEEMLQDTEADPTTRAVYLSWLIHLVGDSHQPLHCETLVTADYPAPLGDKGGNFFFVRPANSGMKLHAVWDQALGSSINFKTQSNYATQIGAVHSRTGLPELASANTPENWSLESRGVAIESGYLNGALQGGKTAGSAVPLPANYTKNLKTVAEKRAALAGYRLADEISQNVN